MDPSEHLRPESEPYHQILEKIAEDWDLETSRTQLIRNGVNHVYRAKNHDDQNLVVRLSDSSYRHPEQIESELRWLDYIAQHGCSVPTPVPNVNGELIEVCEHNGRQYYASLFQWLNGHNLWCREDIIAQPEYQRNLGRIIGRLHRVNNGLVLPVHLRRGHWYEETTLFMPADIPDYLDPLTAEAMYRHQEKMRTLSLEADSKLYGLCHGDLHGLNMLYDNGQIWLLDFELGCYCWRCQDFCVLLMCDYLAPIWCVDGATSERAREFIKNAVAGYREEYEFDSCQLELINDLVAIREIIIYILIKSDPEKWDRAIPWLRGSMSEFICWMEERWKKGKPEYEWDFSGI